MPRPLLARVPLVVALVALAGCGGEETPPQVVAPAAPTLAVNVALKALSFTWSASAGTERYRLLQDPEGSSAFATLEDNLPATTTSVTHEIGVHRLDWNRAQYAVEACNAAGCSRSGPVNVDGQAANAVGYLKASDTPRRGAFGSAVAVSGDGRTAAVGAIGPNGIGGAVYVFTHDANGWTAQARLKGNGTEAGDQFGTAVALSADGSTLIVGAPYEDGSATGVNGNEANNARTDSGAAYVFVRGGTQWSQQAYLKASNTGSGDAFGSSVSISTDGNTAAAGAPYEDSHAIKVNGNQADDSEPDAGAAYVFGRESGSWSQQAYVKANNTEAEDWFGYSLALSGNGNTLLVGAPWEDSAATGINGKQGNNASKAGAAYLFTRSGTAWSQSAYIKASTTGIKDWFGWSVAISGDGTALAIAAPGEDSSADGIGGDQTTNGRPNSGAVYVFGQSGSTWQQTAYIKASNPDGGDEFGWALGLNGNGDTLAVGAWEEDSAAVVLGGDQGNNAATDAGAVYVFRRNGSTWAQQAFVKALNVDIGDHFGYAVSLSTTGEALLVGAPAEASAATGIGGDRADNSRLEAGAAYLY